MSIEGRAAALVLLKISGNHARSQTNDVAHVEFGCGVTGGVGKSLSCTIAVSNDLHLTAISSCSLLSVKDGADHVADILITDRLSIEVPVKISLRCWSVGIVD